MGKLLFRTPPAPGEGPRGGYKDNSLTGYKDGAILSSKGYEAIYNNREEDKDFIKDEKVAARKAEEDEKQQGWDKKQVGKRKKRIFMELTVLWVKLLRSRPS